METRIRLGVSARRKASTGSFSNHGGPVIASPKVYALFWGTSWGDVAHKAQSGRLIQFLEDLQVSIVMNLLAQYGVGRGTYEGSRMLNISGALTDAGVQKTLQGLITQGSLPEPTADSVFIVFLDENVDINDPGNGLVLCAPSGDTAFGYHWFFRTAKGHPCYYAIIPALTNACLMESCGTGPGCTLSLADTQEERRTEVTTHEFGEMVTDPQGTTWIDSQGNEIGDVCAGNDATILVDGRAWKVQTLWDNKLGTCGVGAQEHQQHQHHLRQMKRTGRRPA